VVEETCSPMRESVAAREGRGGQSQSRHVARGAKVSRGWWCISLGLVVGRGRGIPRQGIRERETRRVSEINGTSCKRQTDEREREREREIRETEIPQSVPSVRQEQGWKIKGGSGGARRRVRFTSEEFRTAATLAEATRRCLSLSLTQVTNRGRKGSRFINDDEGKHSVCSLSALAAGLREEKPAQSPAARDSSRRRE